MVSRKPQILGILALLSSMALGQISPDQFSRRRTEIKAQLKPGDRMILLTNPVRRRNGDVDYVFRPDSDFWYATGLNEPMAALVLASDPITIKADDRTLTGTEFLFLRERDPQREVWEGYRIGVKRAPELLQIEHALNVRAFAQALESIFHRADTVYLNLSWPNATPPLHALAEATLAYLPPDGARPRNPFERLRNGLGRLKKLRKKTARMGRKLSFKGAGEILNPMRFIKSDEELALLQRAIDITGQSQVAAMKRAAAGIYEYQLQADIEHVYKDSGARRPGFPSIVASGPNSLILHYQRNDRQIRDGELILIDIGAEYQMYTADITRTIPASGHFSDAQKEIYNHVLQAQELAMGAVKPGVSLRELHGVAKTYLDSVRYGQYFIHGLSHWLGMDVHDVRPPDATIQPGSVFTIEPGIYIPADDESVEPRYRGIGVRIEDDYMATEDGYVHLSRHIPRTVEEIEQTMNEGN